MERVANSTPIVDLESMLNSLRVNRLKRLDFPTPESPIRTTIDEVVSVSARMTRTTWLLRGRRGAAFYSYP